MTRKVDRAALIESAAITLYEAGRGVEYIEPDWDWPNIDRSYDRDDEDDGDPEWLRNRYRSEARDVLDAVLPLVAQAIEEMPVYTDIGVIVRSSAARLVRSLAEGGQQQ